VWPAAPVAGQLTPPVRMEVTVGAGTMQPGTDLARRDDLPGGALRLGGSLALGVTGALQLAGGFGLEAQALWAPNMALEDPGGTREGKAHWLGLMLDAVYRPPLPFLGSLLEPFLGAGLGVRKLSPHPDSFACPPLTGFTCYTILADTTARSDFAAQGLVGTYVGVPGLPRLRLELRDYVTSFSDSGDARLQNDVSVLGSVVFRVP
jgi:hypothetical protein